MNMDLATNQLFEFIKTHDIEKRTMDSFWEAFDYFKNNNPDKFHKYFGNGDKCKVNVEIRAISLKLGNWPECTDGHNHVVVYMPMRYDNYPVGEYTIWFSFDGEIADDMFLTQ